MGKDPAFLFYSKDWFTDTMEMTAAERGVYINFLSYQHINGSIPGDMYNLEKIALCGANEDFKSIWKNIKMKFKPLNRTVDRTVDRNGDQHNDRLVNWRIDEEVKRRQERGRQNTIIGTFASLLRMSKLSKKQKEVVKKQFDVNAFLNSKNINESTERLTERLTEWFSEVVTVSHETATATATEAKTKYGEFSNVLLTAGELKKLNELFDGGFVKKKIQALSEHIRVKNPGYGDHFVVLRSWCKKDFKKGETEAEKKLREYGERFGVDNE